MFQMKLDMVASWLSCTLFSGCGLCLVAFIYYIIAVPVAGTGGLYPVVGAGPVVGKEKPPPSHGGRIWGVPSAASESGVHVSLLIPPDLLGEVVSPRLHQDSPLLEHIGSPVGLLDAVADVVS